MGRLCTAKPQKKLKAVKLALLAPGSMITCHNITIFSHSSVVVAVLKKPYTTSWALQSSLAKIICLLQTYNIKLDGNHIGGKLDELVDLITCIAVANSHKLTDGWTWALIYDFYFNLFGNVGTL